MEMRQNGDTQLNYIKHDRTIPYYSHYTNGVFLSTVKRVSGRKGFAKKSSAPAPPVPAAPGPAPTPAPAPAGPPSGKALQAPPGHFPVRPGVESVDVSRGMSSQC